MSPSGVIAPEKFSSQVFSSGLRYSLFPFEGVSLLSGNGVYPGVVGKDPEPWTCPLVKPPVIVGLLAFDVFVCEKFYGCRLNENSTVRGQKIDDPV
jgi:hypothetical protein